MSVSIGNEKTMGVDVQRAINPPKRKGPMPEKSYCEETHCLDTNFEKKK